MKLAFFSVYPMFKHTRARLHVISLVADTKPKWTSFGGCLNCCKRNVQIICGFSRIFTRNHTQ